MEPSYSKPREWLFYLVTEIQLSYYQTSVFFYETIYYVKTFHQEELFTIVACIDVKRFIGFLFYIYMGRLERE